MALWDDTRDDWGARPPLSARTAVAHRDRVGVAWHWAGPPTRLGGKAHTSCLSMCKSWQAYHQSKGWKDIGYNGLICVHARAIEGRGAGFSGSHSPGWNTSHYGVQYMIGEGEKATPAMLDRGRRVHADLEALAGHDLTDKCHSDNTSTDCPGDQLRAWVRSGAPDQPTPPPEDDDMEPKDVWNWDGIPSPDKDPDNPHWQAASYLRETFRLVRNLNTRLAALEAAVKAGNTTPPSA